MSVCGCTADTLFVCLFVNEMTPEPLEISSRNYFTGARYGQKRRPGGNYTACNAKER